MEMSS